ncbi:MAG: HEPN domain-containing protein [Candidatus Hydrothermarchaeales archaeon]
MDKVEYHLKEAEERLEAAKILLENKRIKDAISRAYYCMYHAARALLLTKDLSPKTHKGVIQKFGEEFVKTEKISREYSSILSKAEELREFADYDVVREFSLEEAESVVEDAEKFLSEIKEFLKED